MSEEKTRVDFNAPKSLVERADSVADVLDISRTRLLIDALEDKIEELSNNDSFRRRLSESYYEERIDYETVEAILGRGAAMRIKLLRSAIDQSPPEPQLGGELPSDEEFYDGGIPGWSGNGRVEPTETGDSSDNR